MTTIEDSDEPTEGDLEALDRLPLGEDDAGEPCELFDAQIAAAMLADAHHDDMKRQMQRLGERMGAMYSGMLSEGMDSQNAGEIVHAWMVEAVFQRTQRETGTLGM